MTTWYKTQSWWYGNDPIIPVEVVKESRQFVTLGCKGYGGRNIRASKRSSFESYFPTFDEAAQHLLDDYEGHLRSSQQEVQRANEKLNRLRAWLKKRESTEGTD